jgi:hypothetical protein
VHGIAFASKEVGRRIVEDPNFDWQGLIEKLKEEKDLEKIGVCVMGIANASAEVAQKVFQGLEPEVQNILPEEFP